MLDYKSIGKRIKIARIRAEMTQEQLAEKADISPTHCSNIETGTTRVSLTTIVEIANALDITANDLLCDQVKAERVTFEKEISAMLSDCDNQEIRMICDLIASFKETYRKNHI